MSQQRRQGRPLQQENGGPVSGLQEVGSKSTRTPLKPPSTQSRPEGARGAPPHLADFLSTLFVIAVLICLAALCVRAMRVADNVAELIALAIAAAVLGAGALWVLSRDEAS